MGKLRDSYKSSHHRAKTAAQSRNWADLDRLRGATDAAIRRTASEELRELPAGFWDDAIVVTPEVIPIPRLVDSDVLEWLRDQEPEYQSWMNAARRSAPTCRARGSSLRNTLVDHGLPRLLLYRL